MNKNLSYFVYSLPKSNAQGHRVKDKNIYRGLRKAFDAFATNFLAYQSGNIQLELSYSTEDEQEILLTKNSITKLNDFLGLPVREWKNNKNELIQNSVIWESETKNIFDILEYFETHKTNSILLLNHFTITQFYYYGTKITQNAQILFTIASGKLYVKVYLILPFATESVYQLLCNLHKELPFKLNPKNFRRLGPNNKSRQGLWRIDDHTQKLLDSCLE